MNENNGKFIDYLRKNAPVESSSASLKNRLLQKTHTPPSVSPRYLLWFTSTAIAFLLLYIISSHAAFQKAYPSTILPHEQNPRPQVLPEAIEKDLHEQINTQPVDIIAANEWQNSNKGCYELMESKRNDFNLSFFRDSSRQTMLCFARELYNS